MKELQLQLQKDKPGLATSLEQKFRAFEYLTCWPHHAPTETKYFSLPAQPGLKGQPGLEGGMYEMEPYVINYCRVVDTLHILYEVLKAIFPSECTVNPHLPTPLQCQQNKYVNCGRGASCKHNSSSQGCKFRHADSLEQQHDARLAQDYDGERSRFFDMYHRMALHCCKYGLSCYGRCGYRHHSNCTCAAEYLASTSNSCGSASPNSSFDGSCSSSDCTDEYDGDIRLTSSSSSSSGSTTVEAFDTSSDWTVVGNKTMTATTTTASATASVFNKGAKGRKGVKSSTVPLLPTLTTIGTTATMNSKAPPTWCDRTKSTSAYRLEKLISKKTTTK
jgi:hypothetical protein